MSETHRNRLLLEVSQPEAAKKPESRNPYQEGEDLPRNIEEDVSSHMLQKTYTRKQQRTIKRKAFRQSTFAGSKAKRHTKRRSRQFTRSNVIGGENWY